MKQELKACNIMLYSYNFKIILLWTISQFQLCHYDKSSENPKVLDSNLDKLESWL